MLSVDWLGLPLVVWVIILLALAFDYINGFHDAANSIATVVSTRVLSPRAAVAWAAFFNFAAFVIFPLKVATGIAKDVVDPVYQTMPVIAACLVGATVWDLVTWYYGIPSSSSHALVGGLVGAAVVSAGFGAIKVGLALKGIVMVSLFIVIAPTLGLVLGFLFMVATYWIFRRASPSKVSGLFRKLQFISASAYSLGHGGNDAQKTMGIIFAALLVAGAIKKDPEPKDPPKAVDSKGVAKKPEPKIPTEVVLACHAAMGLGTLAGGWRIVKTMGQKICQLQPVHGFSAETAGAATLYFATWLGAPVSTTHTITGSIVGVGLTRGWHAVKWGVAGRVVWAWVITIPASAAIAMLFWWIFNLCGWK